MLTRNRFKVLAYLARNDTTPTQRDISTATGLSLGTVNSLMRKMRNDGLVARGSITQEGRKQLKPYKVDNAIIMAAGLSSRFAPISYERPKGLLNVRGEVLIERQIRQLQEAGITDITVVVGYMKETFFYLEEDFNVNIVVNPYYGERNNNSTLYLVRDRLKNTYICSSDDYFTQNVFEPYVYEAYYPAVFCEGKTPEYCLKTKGNKNLITEIKVGGRDSWIMLGHAYWDKAFSKKFKEILEEECDLPETYPKLWEDMLREHIDELPMVMREYDTGDIHEFDSLDELCDFDPDFIDNVDSEILDNICEILNCEKRDIYDIVPIKQGLTNLSFRFSVEEATYVYRHPGIGTDKIINRESEAFSQGVAKRLGLDNTFVYESPEKGWKISHFIGDCVPFDYHNPKHVKHGLELGKTLHESGARSDFSFEIYDEALKIVDLLASSSRTSFPDFTKIQARIERLHQYLKADDVEPCLCHNDFYAPNFLINDECFYLIDWEYSGMSDYASDLGTFICCSDYDFDEAVDTIGLYFGREPSPEELRHCLAYVAVSGFYWYVWAIYQEVAGSSVGEYLYTWYRYAKKFSKRALKLYEA